MEAKIHKAALTSEKSLANKSFAPNPLIRLVLYVLLILLLVPFHAFVAHDLGSIVSADWLASLAVGFFLFGLTEVLTRIVVEKNSEEKLKRLIVKETEYEQESHRNTTLLVKTRELLELLGDAQARGVEDVAARIESLTKKDDLRDKFRHLVQAKNLGLSSLFDDLRAHGSLDNNYQLQFELAGIFCGMAHRRFWATSTDRPSVFQRKNFGYYQIMNDVAARIADSRVTTGESGSIPSVARVFIGTREEFAADIMNEHELFLELYKMHLFLGRNRESKTYPVRFYINDNIAYDRLFGGLEHGTPFIRDFMLVDDLLVYGREGNVSLGRVKLRFTMKQEDLQQYELIFANKKKIWDSAISMKDLVTEIFKQSTYVAQGDIKQRDLLSVVENIESKLDIEQDYRSTFEDVLTLEGDGFLDRVCDIVSRSGSSIVALDRADLKTKNFWRAWVEVPEYQAFWNACKACAQKGHRVRRLFIIENRQQESERVDAKTFVKRAIEDRIEVRFIDSKYVNNLPLRYLSDFIVSGVSEETLNGIVSRSDQQDWRIENEMKDWLGFELFGDQYFHKSSLSFESNLIAKRVIKSRIQDFMHLWGNPHAIGLSNLSDAGINELLENIFTIEGKS